ncbi:DUF2267 domain-containing protein [Streptomyces xantholiticus]|uniref:DUF2267 domain-containing protein n=1 Tax=Streptomyces xantholiticus TaxID=68285 RepID=UPI0016789B59|nr:DUF2267 domain-containing protein [Streptomyces xantholiticus]GGW46770.1 hypothetical protein GCM10010381_34940 [Streptomyces xantholiticus]
MQWQQLVHDIRLSGRYTTSAEAERVVLAVLTVLGGQVSGDERCALARLLPQEAAEVFTRQIPLTEPLSAPAFVDAVAGHLTHVSAAEARWATGTVLTLLARHAGDELTRRILARLPRGYALLFGLADLTPAAAA